VSLNELEQGAKPTGFDTTRTGFSKKDNKVNKYFIIGGVLLALVIVVLLILAMTSIRQH